MRPVTSQVAAEIGYDPAGGTDPGPFTQQVAERLHAADPRWGRRINSTGPISDDTVAYRGRDPPPSTPSASISYSPPIPPTPGSSGTPTIIGRRRRGPIPLYPGISRYIPAYLGSFFLFAGMPSSSCTLAQPRCHRSRGRTNTDRLPDQQRMAQAPEAATWCTVEGSCSRREDRRWYQKTSYSVRSISGGERWTPSFGQVFVTAKVESRFMIQATLG